MRISLLGPLELIDDDGNAVTLASRRQRQLLTALAMNRNQPIDVDAISELIWGEQQPDDPAGTVQTNVSRLRRTLDQPFTVETGPAGYVFSCPGESCDVARFELLVDRTRRAGVSEIPDVTREALSLWRGSPFADLDHPDVEAERQRLTELRIEMAEMRADSLGQLGRHAEAVEAAETLVREHPYRERPVATLMRSLYASGRQADALGVFADLRTRLLDDLGVDPSIELRDLELAILRQSVDTPTPSIAGNGGLPPTPGLAQRIQICITGDGTRLAYAVSGNGPPLVKAANWMTHLDYDWESPVWRHWNAGLSRHHSLIRYDERGCGLSDRDVERFSFDAWVDDLASVVDDLGLEHFPLLGISQGAAVAIAYAVRYPDRVTNLILWGGYPRGRMVRAVTEEERQQADLNLELARVGWGTGDPTFRQVFTMQFMPDGTREQWDAFNELMRRTCSPENAVRFMEVFATIDVTELAPKVQCPTLIMHSREELRVPMDNARELAALIPGSQLVLLESRNHILGGNEPAWDRFLGEVHAFLSDGEPETAPRPSVRGRP